MGSKDYEVIFFLRQGRAPFVAVVAVSLKIPFQSKSGDRGKSYIIRKCQARYSARLPVVARSGRGRIEAFFSCESATEGPGVKCREGVIVDQGSITKERIYEHSIQSWSENAALTDTLGVLNGLGFCIVPEACGSGPGVPGCNESEEFTTYSIGMKDEVETLSPDGVKGFFCVAEDGVDCASCT